MTDENRMVAEPTLIGTQLDLSLTDAGLLEQACRDLLEQAGIDAERFFERLRQGRPIGEALGLSPEIAELLYARAHRWFSIDRPDRAEPLFRALCIAVGDDADYWVGLGVCLRLRKDWDAAALAFATASRLRPDWSIPVFHGCELAMAVEDFAGARRQLDRFWDLAGLQSSAPIPKHMRLEAERISKALEMRLTMPEQSM